MVCEIRSATQCPSSQCIYLSFSSHPHIHFLMTVPAMLPVSILFPNVFIPVSDTRMYTVHMHSLAHCGVVTHMQWKWDFGTCLLIAGEGRQLPIAGEGRQLPIAGERIATTDCWGGEAATANRPDIHYTQTMYTW